MKRQTRHILPLVIGLCVLASSALLRAMDPGMVEIVRERVFDLYQRVDPPALNPELPVRIVDVDDASLATHGQWPWPRSLVAEMVTTLRDAGAAVVAFDMIFPEPDRTSPLTMLDALDLSAPLAGSVREALADTPTNDALFAQALSTSPSVLGTAMGSAQRSITPSAGLAMVGPSPATNLTRSSGVISNLNLLNEAASGLGGINVSASDDDAVVRRIPALTLIGDPQGQHTLLPSLFVEALRVAQGAQSLVLRSNADPREPERGIPQDMQVGALTMPLTSTGSYRIRYGTQHESLTLSASTVLAARHMPAELAAQVGGTIVLVGTSAPGLFDLRASPLGTIVPGVTMHAQAITNIISGTHLSRPDWTLGLELLLLLITGLIVIVAALTLRPVLAAAVAMACTVALGAGSWLAFADHLLLIDASFPTMATLLTFGAVTVPVLIGTDKQQRFIRNAFSHYLAEPVLARLENNPDALKLDGERRTITILFMDVRGFTTRSESMEPTDAVDLLNALLDPLSEAVLAQEGTIDKFMGDGMMAFWNAPLDQPDHAARGLRAGLAMMDVIAKHNATAAEQSSGLAIGVGIHTGEAFVGNMGSKRRFTYSAIGDSVNLAARVEALTGTLSKPLLVTQETLDMAAKNDATLAARFVSAGEHSVKGRAKPAQVHTLKA